MSAPYVIEIKDWSPEWPVRFRTLAGPMRSALGAAALRIDHIGSTSIEGLAAKPIIDIQISVAVLDSFDAFGVPLRRLGYQFRDQNPELTKRYFREPPGTPRTHIHVRERGSWHEQWALLFRDYMRASPTEHAGYVAVKRRLAEQFPNDSQAYTDAKDDILWQIIYRADRWACDVGWRPGPSDA